ncbi:MAG: sulfatase-like hydrolase/transferase, partial [Lentisphaeria bacterium]|nr:sulfatase-like hydrolase/transferase [Lentisphaeria bacterium]
TGVTCCPSRTGFMTGLSTARFYKYPSAYGFGNHITITELLKKSGYRTGHFGKWHIGPKNKTSNGTYGIDVIDNGKGGDISLYGRDAGLVDAAIKFIKKNANGDKPFYVNIWGHSTHSPVKPHPNFVKPFSNLVVKRSDFSKTMQTKFNKCESVGGNITAAMKQYVADVNAMDKNIARLLKTIDDLGIRDNTLFVFTSDQGPGKINDGKRKNKNKNKQKQKQKQKQVRVAEAHPQNMVGYAGTYRGGKHDQYEGGVRVPFIMRWPGHIKAGVTDTQNIISGMDWLPTLCSIAGIKDIPKKLDCEDVSDIWFGKIRPRTKTLYWKTHSNDPSMRDGKWKLHFKTKRIKGKKIKGKKISYVELYDLSVDPSESNNVADKHPKLVKRLSAKLSAWVNELPKKYFDNRDRNRKK